VISAILLSLAAAAAQPGAAPAAVNYARPQNWLCLPGRNDICSTPLPTTELGPGGYGASATSRVTKDPPIDCFYVYPTISGDRGLNSDLAVREEIGAVQSQFARFSSVCRPFVPIYRQMTLGAVAASAVGTDLRAPGELAYSDIAAAWRTYLAAHNKGRPFVLVGHSQGSLMLQELIKREIEGKPVARRMLRAIIPGYNVLVPQGKRVGGTFRSTPLCSSPTELGCVMTWVSFRENNPPPEGAMFGWAAAPGMTVGCTNPAKPGSTAWEPLVSYWYARSSYPVAGGPIRWSSEGPPPTPYLRTQGLVSARCVNSGTRGYLEIRTNADPKDKRTDRIGGEVGIMGMFVPGWGMHLADMAIAQGDLIRQVGQLAGRN
jgi:pimeloyl-ACP methyl ester carboxylesterase